MFKSSNEVEVISKNFLIEVIVLLTTSFNSKSPLQDPILIWSDIAVLGKKT